MNYPEAAIMRHKANHNCFSIVNRDSLYWAGLLMADGNVSDRRRVAVIQLQLKDKEHVEKFLAFMESDKPAKERTQRGYKSYYMQMASAQIVNDLASYGVVPRKSKIAEIPAERSDILYSIEWWLGYHDGDGSLFFSNGKPHYCLVSGSKRLLEQFNAFLAFYGLKERNIQKAIGRETFYCVGANRIARDFVNLLYSGDTTWALDRKRLLAEKILCRSLR